MTLNEYMKSVQRDLKGELQKFLDIQIGSGALAMVDSRVRRKGEKGEGGQFKPYSTKPTLIGATSFTSKTHADKVFGKTRNKELSWVTINDKHLAIMPGGYKQIRETEGRQTNHKDFERTSELWKSIHVVGTKELSNGLFQTIVGTDNQRSVNIMEGIADREGSNLLSLSRQEEHKLAEVLAEKIKKIFDQ